MTGLSITEAIQSKHTMQQSFLIQVYNESKRTIIYRCMASLKKQLMFWGRRGVLKIAITNAGICMAETFLCKRRKQGRRNSAGKTVKAAERPMESKKNYWKKILKMANDRASLHWSQNKVGSNAQGSLPPLQRILFHPWNQSLFGGFSNYQD